MTILTSSEFRFFATKNVQNSVMRVAQNFTPRRHGQPEDTPRRHGPPEDQCPVNF